MPGPKNDALAWQDQYQLGTVRVRFEQLPNDEPQPDEAAGTLQLPLSPASHRMEEMRSSAGDNGEAQDATDELRVTLKEQLAGSDFNATMVISDSIAGDTVEAASAIPLYRPSVRAPMAVIKLYHDGQRSFNQYPMMADRFRIGRIEGDITVPHDSWMSGRHAEIQRRRSGGSYRWFLVDLNSTNGTFIQASFATLKHNDELFLGQERYRFTFQEGRAGLIHVTTGAGQQWWLSGSSATIGRQLPCGLRGFATDPFLDNVHAKLKCESNGSWTIADNNSRNGVWFRIKEVEISPNCEFQLGEQRFGFWSQTDPPTPTQELHLASKLNA